MNDAQRTRLENYLQGLWPAKHNLSIQQIASLSDGWESDVYGIQIRFGDAVSLQSEEWIVRAYFGRQAQAKAAREEAALRLLTAAAYPVPKVIHRAQEESPLDRPFLILEKIDGKPMGPVIGRAAPQRQGELMSRFCELFANLHQLEWQAHVNAGTAAFFSAPVSPLQAQLDFMLGFYERFPKPDFWPFFTWLATHAADVKPAPLALIHWDFHPENILLGPDDATVVIDWTQAQISDPRFDLAWTLTLIGAAAGWAVRERILSEYERLSGAAVESLPYFEVAACTKRLYSVAVSVSFGAEQLGMRPGAEQLMARHGKSLTTVYERLQTLTGLVLPEMEQLPASWRG
jgi:aminoglycoside phosphotransferase (APT) family kinase protein